jgi:hypothetical protein
MLYMARLTLLPILPFLPFILIKIWRPPVEESNRFMLILYGESAIVIIR